MPGVHRDAAASAQHTPLAIDGLVSLEIREAPANRSSVIDSPQLRWIDDKPPEPPTWLVKKLLPQKGVALLSGQYSAGKTFVALDIALSIGLGIPFLGKRVTQGGVLWIAAEGGGEIDPRVLAARQAKFDGEHGGRQTPPFAWTDRAPPLATDDGFRWLDDTCRRADDAMQKDFGVPLRLVPIDTLAAAFALEDENDNAAAAALMKRLADFGNERDLLMMPIAHLGKNAEAGTRGASAFGAGADAVLSVLANGDPMKGVVTSRSLVLSKLRRGSTGPLGFFELEEVDLGQDADGDAITSCFVRFTDASSVVQPTGQPLGKGERELLDALDETLARAGKEHRPLGDGPKVRAADVLIVRRRFEERYVTGEEGKKKTSAARTAWGRALTALKAKSAIACDSINGVEMMWRIV